MCLIKCVKRSLFELWDQKSPLALGYSGGPDSVALLEILLEIGVRPILIHVDHGWREESRLESALIEQKARGLRLSFFSIRLEPALKNLEEESRKSRFAFFKEVVQKTGCQAILLAHHGDDKIETSMQRLFEGAYLPFLSGIRMRETFWGVEVWRPMLEISKEEILSFLQKRGVSFFEDSTNEDSRFLRGRIRLMLKEMKKTFQKEFRNNLSHFAFRTEELKNYLEKKTQEAHDKRVVDPNTISWDLSGLEKVEARFLLQRSVGSIPRTVLEPMLEAAFLGKKRKKFLVKGGEWMVFGHHISFTQRKLK